MTPTTEEIAYDLNGATVFSRIDLDKAFHQIELSEESREIKTFVTHLGFFRFKRLHMGVCSASEEFQHALQKALTGLSGVRNIADDIIVYAKDEDEHDERLIALCERLKQSGLTASADNCELGVFNFFGLKLSKDGVALGDDKIQALLKAEAPTTVSEVHSLLGLAVYAGNYIPNLATLAKPLWDLTREGAEFKWEPEQMKALQAIKNALVTTVLDYFNTKWITEVTTDASPVGLGLVCAQIDPDNEKNRKIIIFGSRTLFDVERRYSQVEKEALAIVWACEKLRMRLLGSHFRLVTDNRAVQLIFSNPESKPPARIERWALRMMNFDYEIVHRPGKWNIADYLSRHPIKGDHKNELEEDTESYVFQNQCQEKFCWMKLTRMKSYASSK